MCGNPFLSSRAFALSRFFCSSDLLQPATMNDARRSTGNVKINLFMVQEIGEFLFASFAAGRVGSAV